jgi:uncharacterized protein with NAD-binding domain and iron-sulfur cluster
MVEAARTKVAVLGSGCGAMSAAFWLSATEELRAKYDVTVYTPDWRLGGKCASGRAGSENRALEHGLHMLMGFYDVTFHVMRDCYSKMHHQPDDAFTAWNQAFAPQYLLTLWFKFFGEWKHHDVTLPPNNGEPGTLPPTLDIDTAYMRRAVRRILEILADALKKLGKALDDEPWFLPLKPFLDQQATELLQFVDADVDDPVQRAELVKQVQHSQEWITRELSHLLHTAGQPNLVLNSRGDLFKAYVLYLLSEVGLAGCNGFLLDVLPHGEPGFGAIDHLDFKRWLMNNGCAQIAAESTIVMSMYDLAFAYTKGDSRLPANGQAAAGAMLRLFIRMTLTYEGAPLWRMNGGMGDIVFTPLFAELERRGVAFRFFHKVTDVHLSNGAVSQIDYACYPTTSGAPYVPQFDRVAYPDSKRWDCWRNEPDWDQLLDGTRMRAEGFDFEDPWDTRFAGVAGRLEQGRDFDLVVLGIPPAASEHITQSFNALCPEWGDMLTNTKSVATQSAQLWLTKTPAELGWPCPTVGVGFEDPMRSWGEMSHILRDENWPVIGGPHSCEYLAGTLVMPLNVPRPGASDPGYMKRLNQGLASEGKVWLQNYASTLWPGLPTGTVTDTLVFAQYYRGNVAYSERYVQSLPGTLRYRLKPGWRGIPNLYLAGDWTWSSVNGGCAEAAFESGMRAASAITGQPPPVLQ